MSHTLQLPLPDTTYRAIESLATKRGQTPEILIQMWLEEKLEEEEEAAKYDAVFHNDPEWVEGARKALEQANAGQGKVYHSSEEFLQALDEIRCECGDSDANL